MQVNWTGLTAALAVFIGIWSGHVAVRKIEASVVSLRLPVAAFALAGAAVEAVSLFIENRSLSAALGLFGVTLLWDAFELLRQQKRVMRGHAPANPTNPRHARILAQYPAATTFDRLKREPTGRRENEGDSRWLSQE